MGIKRECENTLCMRRKVLVVSGFAHTFRVQRDTGCRDDPFELFICSSDIINVVYIRRNEWLSLILVDDSRNIPLSSGYCRSFRMTRRLPLARTPGRSE